MWTAAERFFKVKESGSDIRTEVIAGITTFMAMAYIIFVNPGILQNAGMPFGALAVSTCLAAGISTLLMAVIANYPVALASGMGMNAFLAFTVCGSMGVPWQTALGAVFIEGAIFIALSVTNIRSMVVDAIPLSLKHAISGGIGLFIALIGFVNGGLVVDDSATLVTLAPFRGNVHGMLTLAGVVVIAALSALRVNGAILWGILIITVVSVPLGLTEIPASLVSLPPSIEPIFLQLDLSRIGDISFWVIIFTFFFVDFFDTVGTLVGVADRAGLLDEKGRLKNSSKALLSDAIGTCAGAALGVSTVTSYVESATGVGVGGRTGLASVVTSILFFLAIFFSPIIAMVPSSATAPALIIVGVLMLMGIRKVDFDDWSEFVPAAMAIFVMPFAYSISAGIEVAFITYPLCKLLSGKGKDVSWMMWFLFAVFVVKELLI